MKAILCEALIALVLAGAAYTAFDAGLGAYLERREMAHQVAMLEREIEHLRVMVEDAAEIYLTRVICPCYDLSAGRCSVYAMRFDVNQECTKITPENLAGLRWLPAHCGYRLASEKKSLAGSPPPLSRKRQKNARKEMERLLGGRVVLYDEEMDLCDYIVGRC